MQVPLPLVAVDIVLGIGSALFISPPCCYSRSLVEEASAAIAREVRFQRRYQEPLDDITIISDLLDGQTKIAFQIKRDLTFGQSDKTFSDAVKPCWETFRSPSFNVGLDHFGVAIGLYSKKIDEHYQRVLGIPQDKALAGLSDRIRKRGRIAQLSTAPQTWFREADSLLARR
jgi:hypothetical protein